MKIAAVGVALAATLGTSLALATAAHAHASYNLSGYGSGRPGSTNGADGQPADGSATWTNGPVGFTGNLPVMWYAGMHSPTQVRTIQTGLAPLPPSGSLLQQVNNYNAANDPDLLADRVLAVGGKSWSDPDNEGQGWGHGLDYGLIHFEPVDEVLKDGPVRFTITLTDDPTDDVSPRLAFALYAGWDTSTTSSRHQDFITSPSPVDNPLGSAGLTLVDYAVATGAGQTLSRTYQLDAAHDGEYTIFIGALGGVAGQYQLTVTTSPDAALGSCQTDLATALADSDGDGMIDPYDTCAATPAGESVDQTGCSVAQYCASMDVSTKDGQKVCKKADWMNDEPAGSKRDADCLVDKGAKGTPPDGYRCVPMPPPAS